MLARLRVDNIGEPIVDDAWVSGQLEVVREIMAHPATARMISDAERFFMHNNERVLITFSAGVALWKTGETQEKRSARADEALYRAKKAGINRTLAAD